MIATRDMGTAAPRMDAPEVMMPQESRAEVDRMVDMVDEKPTAEQWAMKIFLQGMAFQRALTAAEAAVAGA